MKPNDLVWFFDDSDVLCSGLVQSVYPTYISIASNRSLKFAKPDEVFSSPGECQTAHEDKIDRESQEYMSAITNKDELINFMLAHMTCTDSAIIRAIYSSWKRFKNN